MHIQRLFHIFLAFFKANILAYGGGPQVIPLMEAEVVRQYGWMTAEEFASALAVGNSLPGPIATKMAAYIGYEVAGALGSLVALIATVMPSAILMVVLAAFLMRNQDAPVVQGMLKAVKAVVFALFALLAIEFFQYAWPGTVGWIPAILGFGGLAAMYFFKVHQAVVIVAAFIVGAVLLH